MTATPHEKWSFPFLFRSRMFETSQTGSYTPCLERERILSGYENSEDQLANVRRLARAGMSGRGRIVAVTSGRGGVGKSNIVLNLAMALSGMGRSVTLFDGAQRSDILFLLGRRPSVEPVEFFRDANGLSDAFFEVENNLRVVSVAGDSGAQEGFELNMKERLLREIIKQSSERDFVLIDTAAGISDLSLDLILKSDEVVVIITPEPSAVSDGYALIKLLSRSEPDIRFSTLVNRVESRTEALEVFERFSLVIDHFLQRSVDLFGYVPEDRRLTRAVRSRKPVLSAYPRCKISKCIRQMAERMDA